VTLCCCVAVTPRSALVQNNTGDDELTALASDALAEQLKANGIAAEDFELKARLEELAGGGLEIQILCSGRADHLLKARVQVKARGASPRKLLRPLMGEAARNLAADCR